MRVTWKGSVAPWAALQPLRPAPRGEGAPERPEAGHRPRGPAPTPPFQPACAARPGLGRPLVALAAAAPPRPPNCSGQGPLRLAPPPRMLFGLPTTSYYAFSFGSFRTSEYLLQKYKCGAHSLAPRMGGEGHGHRHNVHTELQTQGYSNILLASSSLNWETEAQNSFPAESHFKKRMKH